MDEIVFETLDGRLCVFLGRSGERGVWVHHASGWTFHDAGSTRWDDVHQAAFRNLRGAFLDASALGEKGLAPPPTDPPPAAAEPRPHDRPYEAPAEEIPAVLHERLGSLAGGTTVYLVLVEDRYESALGNGKFLYPHAAFWTRLQAEASLPADAGAPTAPLLGLAYSIAPIILRRDAPGHTITCTPAAPFERYGVRDVLRLLAAGGHDP